MSTILALFFSKRDRAFIIAKLPLMRRLLFMHSFFQTVFYAEIRSRSSVNFRTAFSVSRLILNRLKIRPVERQSSQIKYIFESVPVCTVFSSLSGSSRIKMLALYLKLCFFACRYFSPADRVTVSVNVFRICVALSFFSIPISTTVSIKFLYLSKCFKTVSFLDITINSLLCF